MSDYEQHSGKLKKIEPNPEESFFALIQRIYKEEDFEWDEKYTEDTDYFDEMRDKYFIVDREIYKIIEHIIEHQDAFIHMNHGMDGAISFSTTFYNGGGTCLSEMIEDGIRELKNS